MIPWDRERVLAVRTALPDRYAVVVTLAAGLGLRQGEVFGLSPDDVDFLRGRKEVRRQVKLFSGNRQVFALPKGRKTRTVPLPDSVRDVLAEYLTRYPARTVSLPWEQLPGDTVRVPLLPSTRETSALNRNYFNTYVWKKALVSAAVERPGRTGATRCGTSTRAHCSTPVSPSRRSASTSVTPTLGSRCGPTHTSCRRATSAHGARLMPPCVYRVCTRMLSLTRNRRSVASSSHYFDI